MTRKLVLLMASAAIIAAAGIGLAAGFISRDFPSTAQPAAQVDQAAAIAPGDLKTGAAPDPGPAAGPDVKVAETEAATQKPRQTEYGQWVFSCMDVPAGEPEKCAARLAVRDTKRNVTVVNWLIGYNKNRELLMEITTPVDVLIQPGLQMGMGDGAARSFPYLSCAPSGCLTRISPDAPMLEALRKAEIVKLSIATTAGKTITFSIKITGIADSLDALAHAKAG